MGFTPRNPTTTRRKKLSTRKKSLSKSQLRKLSTKKNPTTHTRKSLSKSQLRKSSTKSQLRKSSRKNPTKHTRKKSSSKSQSRKSSTKKLLRKSSRKRMITTNPNPNPSQATHQRLHTFHTNPHPAITTPVNPLTVTTMVTDTATDTDTDMDTHTTTTTMSSHTAQSQQSMLHLSQLTTALLQLPQSKMITTPTPAIATAATTLKLISTTVLEAQPSWDSETETNASHAKVNADHSALKLFTTNMITLSTSLGLKMLLTATTTQETHGEPFTHLTQLDSKLS